MNNFTSLVHGDIGTLLADYMALPSLAAWSQCNRNGRMIVQHKFSHMKRLDLRQHANLRHTDFGHLCERLRGIDVLEWSIDDSIFSSTLRDESIATDFAPLRSFQRLLLANASHLRVLLQTRREKDNQLNWRPTQIIDKFTTPVLVAMREMAQLEVVQIVLGTKYHGRFTQQNTDEETSNVDETTGSNDTDMINTKSSDSHQNPLFGPYDFNYSVDFQPDIEPVDIIMKVIDQADSIVGTVQEEAYEKLHLEQHKPKLQAPVSPVHFSPYSTLRHIRSALDVRDISEFFRQMPDLISCRLDSFLLTEFTNDDGQATSIQQREHSIRFSAPNGLTLTQSLGESLLCLTIQLEAIDTPRFPKYSHVSLLLPHVREFILYLQWTDISDISFVCPELIKLDLQCSCQKSEEEQTHPQNLLFVSTPPSIISSLRHSPKLKYLIFVGLGGELLDLTPILSEEEKHEMDAKATALGQPSLFGNFKLEDREKHLLRILYYALSLLPCAPNLRMIDDITMRLSFTEFLTLFPSIRSICFIPFWSPPDSAGVVWLRPPREFDFMQPYYNSQLIMTYYQQHTNVNPDDLVKVLFVKDEKQPTEYLHLADADIAFDLKASQICFEKGIYNNLHCLFLHGPTPVEPAALTLLFRESRLLAHASLMQLEGIGNEVFTALPADFVLPALLTLRIKTPCGASRSQSFNADVLDKLTHLFPSITHLEWLTVFDADYTRLVALLSNSSPRCWPDLRELSLIDMDDGPLLDLPSRTGNGGECRINFVTTFANTPIDELPIDWQVSNAGRRVISSTTNRGSREIMNTCEESSCYRNLCHLHRREAPRRPFQMPHFEDEEEN